MEPNKEWKKMNTLKKMLWSSSKTKEEYHSRLLACYEYQRLHPNK